MKYFAVAGVPILHSKSPQVFNSFFKQKGIDAKYTRLYAESAEEVIFLYKELGLSGMSVTAPYKMDIMPLLDYIDERAKAIGSVNTVVERNGKLCGYNTDYDGIVDTLKDISGKNVLLLGAGGAANAVAYSIIGEKGNLTIYNRTQEKARILSDKYDAKICLSNELEEQVKQTDIIINTLPFGVKVLENNWLESKHIVFDAIYHNSAYEQACIKKNIKFFSGNHWLVNQAIPAYKLFMEIEGEVELDFPDLLGSNIADKLAFIGFMGTGKSALGKTVSQKLNINFFCTDNMIVKKENKTINEIFNEKGESHFRKTEQSVLKLLSTMQGRAVISSGGGMVLNEKNRKLIAENYISICLYSSPESIILNVDPEHRPLLRNNFTIESVSALLSERNPYYVESADIIFNTGHKHFEEVVEKIVEELKVISYV